MATRTATAWNACAKPGWTVRVAGSGTTSSIDADGVRAMDQEFASDLELVAACRAARPGAFDVLVARHRRTVYQLCYRFVGNHEDANDLSQEVFLRAYRGLSRFRGNAALSTWLYRIGVNACLNHVGVKKALSLADPIEPERHIDDRSEDPVESVVREERAALVRAAIAQLPDKQRATLILRTYHELSHQEIADILGNSVGAVKANFFHALRNLKQLLAGEPL